MIKHQLLVAAFASIALAGWSQGTEIIVESFSDGLNSQGFSSVQGTWTESEGKSTAPGLKATKTVFNDANTDPAVARFSPDIQAAGKYEVFITYPAQGNANDVKYSVLSADGKKEIALTQNGRDLSNIPAADQWYSLGVYNFTTGVSGYVEVSDPLTGSFPLPNEPNARIYADAVKFVPSTGTVTTVEAGGAPAQTAAAPATTATVGQMSVLPTPVVQVVATPADMPGLPAVQAASTSGTVAALPTLPAITSAADPAAQLPMLPEAPSAAAGLPALPAASAGALPDLLPPQIAATSSPAIVTAQATPYPIPNLPSLAPVTPTPERTLPSPADTPMTGMPTGLPGGALSTLPPAPAMPSALGSEAAFPTPAPFAAAVPGAVPTAHGTPAPFGLNSSITQYNPANLQWMYDFGAALNTARAQNKKVLVFFTAAGNKAANTYETNYFVDPSVRQALDKYVLIKVDFPKNTRLGYSLGIFGAGIIVVTNSAGDVTARITQLPSTPLDLVNQMASAKPAQAAPTPPSANGTTATVVGSIPGDGAVPTPAPGMPAMPALPAMPDLPAMPELPAVPGAAPAPVAATPIL